MEVQNWIIWIGTGLLFLAVFVPYVRKFRMARQVAAAKSAEARSLGIHYARSQYPIVDPVRCIGCSACVDACPEGDVLGVVRGVATVINGLRCVGHGCCAEACPVEAITIGLGDISERDDIPQLSEHYETTVPGLYIAGELGGMSLIRNAINQGRDIINHIADHCKDCSESSAATANSADVIIVGAGPAGLSAALTAIQHNLSYILLDTQKAGGTILHYPRRKLVMTQPVEIPLYGWLENTEYSKESLVAIWTDIIREFEIKVRSGERVESVHLSDDGLMVRSNADTYIGRSVVLAMGRRGSPRRLGVPGEEHTKVMYELEDAQSYTNKNILVVGGGDSAIEAAVGLARQPGNRVTISYRKSAFFRVKKKNDNTAAKLIASGEIQALFESQVQSITERSVTLSTPGGDTEIPNDYVFVFIGGVPPFAMMRAMGVQFGGSDSRIERPAPY